MGATSCQVALASVRDRGPGVRRAIELLGDLGVRGRAIWINATFDNGIPYPATTHLDSLAALTRALRDAGCGPLTLVAQSGMALTRSTLGALGVLDRAKQLGLAVVVLDELPAEEWRVEKLPGSHWKRGVEVPRFLTDGAGILQLCNLGTHRFGAVYAASLQNTVSLIARRSRLDPPYNFIEELQQSPDQRLMIAEVNTLFMPVAAMIDAMQVFIAGGPDQGDVASPGVIAASRDRVAIDAVGVALLRVHGARGRLSSGPIFDVEQIRRAVELKLGCPSGGDISFLTGDPVSTAAGNQLLGLLRETGREKKEDK